MAGAMARGWARSERRPSGMLVADRDRDRAERLASEVGAELAPDNRSLAEQSDLVVLAVKPAALDEVAGEMDGKAPALLSMLGATPLSRIEEAFPGVAAARVIPNQPVEVRRGVLCFAAGPGMDADASGELRELLAALGTVVELEEGLLDAATAVMSCSPAYLAEVAGALAEAGTSAGLGREVAHELVALTLEGTGEMLAEGRSSDQVRDAVATPGGITEKGLEVLAEARVAEAFRQAVELTMERMRR